MLRSTPAGSSVPLVVASIAGVAAIGVMSPAPAVAGSYTAIQCHSGLSPTQGQAILERTSSAYTHSANCAAADGGLEVTHGLANPAASGAYGRWTWRAPAGTVFTDIRAEATLTDGGGDEARLSAITPDGQAVAVGGGVTGQFGELRAGLRCAQEQCNPLAPSPEVNVRNVLLGIDDRSAPTAFLSDGSPLTLPVVRGTYAINFQLIDQGGGMRELELRVNDRAVYEDVLGCQVSLEFATALQPCPAQATRSVALETGADPFSTGRNAIVACGADFAFDGIANQGCQTRQVFVDDLCPASPVGGGSSLSAHFSGGKERVRVRSDRPARVKGKLLAGAGSGVPGATVCALTQARLAGEPYVIGATATTNDDGRYSLRLPAGASRKVFVHHIFADQVLARHGLSVESRVRPSLEIKPKTAEGRRLEDGQRLRFRGTLPGPACTRRVVKVQAKVGKRRWQVFRSVRTGDGCRYKTRYKLRATSEPTRYLFRARVPEQSAYPYEAGVSTVRVRYAGAGR